MMIKISTYIIIFLGFWLNQTLIAAENPAKKGMIEAHNEVRSDVNIAPLRWSNKLERRALKWADHLKKEGCFLEHSNMLDSEVGENLYMTGIPYFMEDRPETEDLDEMVAADVVEVWYSEKIDYQYKSNSCGKAKECRHYTQMVWADTKEVGCAITQCGDRNVNRIWVCNYSPAGNIAGEKPY